MRDEIERVIKVLRFDRTRIYEVSKFKYASIIKQIENTFVLHGANIHWSNMGNGFKHDLFCHYENVSEHMDWYHLLPNIVPSPDELVYVLFEDAVNFEYKYWIYEMYLSEFIQLIDNTNPDDFYIVSKKYDWLISECHEDIVSFVGEKLDIKVLGQL